MNQDRALMKLDAAQQALAECRTAMEAKGLADAMAAMETYLRRTHASVETVNRATEIRTLAEQQMGDFLKTMKKNEGGDPKRPPARTAGGEPTLAEMGITYKESARCQKLAAIPAPEFHERIAVLKAGGEAPTATKVLAMETGFSPRAVAAGEEAARDSEKLWRLKTAWKRCGKRDRAEFAAWLKIQPQA